MIPFTLPTAIILAPLMMLFSCITVVDSGFATLSLDEGVDPKIYTNTNFGISIRYPVSWLISEGDKESDNRVTDIVTISKQETGYTGDLKITLDPDQSSPTIPVSDGYNRRL